MTDPNSMDHKICSNEHVQQQHPDLVHCLFIQCCLISFSSVNSGINDGATPKNTLQFCFFLLFTPFVSLPFCCDCVAGYTLHPSHALQVCVCVCVCTFGLLVGGSHELLHVS